MNIKKSVVTGSCVVVFGLLLVLMAVLFLSQSGFCASWRTETVDPGNDMGEYNSMAIDSNNKVHICYYDSANSNLKYATNASGSWTIFTIDSEGDVGWYTSIAIDSNDKVHISYHDYTNYDLKYATNASGSWETYTIDTEGQAGWWNTSIALDSNNKVHISYHENTSFDLKYATNASGSWETLTIDSEESTGWYTSIAIDSNNKVHISYHNNTNPKSLKYATNASGFWEISTIASGGMGFHTSIGVDSSNNAHISYVYRSVPEPANLEIFWVKYATNASGSWETSTIEMQYINKVEFTSIALDSNEVVHISYVYDYYHDLTYATNASGSWETFSIGSAGQYGSIATDSNSKVHISYDESGNLKYATNSEDDSNATVNGKLTLPAEASGKEYVVIVDNDTEGDNGWINATVGTCGSGTTVDYSINDVPAGTYYVYAVVRIVSAHDSPAKSGDYIGFYGTGIDPPDNPNAVVPSSGTVIFDITLNIWDDNGNSGGGDGDGDGGLGCFMDTLGY